MTSILGWDLACLYPDTEYTYCSTWRFFTFVFLSFSAWLSIVLYLYNNISWKVLKDQLHRHDKFRLRRASWL